MTKLGLGVLVSLVVIFLVGAGFLISRPMTPSTVDSVSDTEIPKEEDINPNPTTTTKVEFDKATTVSLGEKIVLVDGLTLQLKEINDSRCKPDVQCIWQGELAVVLILNNSNEVNLGTVNNKTSTFADYKFTLLGATEKNISIVVSKIKSVISVGYVSGYISIGPFCPVEIEGQPCPVPPEAYSSRNVIIYKKDATTEVKKGTIDAQGNYKITLDPGNYFVQIDPAGIDPGEKKPVVIKASENTVLDFDIDTGIR